MHAPLPPKPPALVLCGDALATLRQAQPGAVNCVVTSPPYFGLRDYGVADQIGLEQSPAEYVARLVEVFEEVRRVLRPDGTLWLNLGDSYVAAPRGNKPGDLSTSSLTNPKRQEAVQSRVIDAKSKQATNRSSDIDAPHRRLINSGLKQKDLIGIPWRVAFALQQQGWYLRQDIIWAKPNPMPESVRDRCTKSHEYLFMLSKSEKYYYDCDAVAEPAKEYKPQKRGPGNWGVKTTGFPGEHDSRGRTSGPVGNGSATRNRRSVWTITTKPTRSDRSTWIPAPPTRAPGTAPPRTSTKRMTAFRFRGTVWSGSIRRSTATKWLTGSTHLPSITTASPCCTPAPRRRGSSRSGITLALCCFLAPASPFAKRTVHPAPRSAASRPTPEHRRCCVRSVLLPRTGFPVANYRARW